jgi:hypothetical protein
VQTAGTYDSWLARAGGKDWDMDEQPDIVSSGPPWRPCVRWPRPGRHGWIAAVALGVLLACLAVTAYLALLLAHRDSTIGDLRAALGAARRPAVAQAPAARSTLPAVDGHATFTLPGGSFSVVAVAIGPGPGSEPLTWLLVYGRHARPGERFGLLAGTCGGQYVASSDLADGIADHYGNVTILAPNLAISPRAASIWVLVYRWQDGVPLGGIQGPLTGPGARIFRSAAPC